MYAVIVSGGKQYRVEEGLIFKIEKLELDEGASVEFSEILMLAGPEGVRTGTPYITGARVTAQVVSHGRAKKIKIIKMRRRKHHRKQMGHRQWYTELKITSIKAA